MKSKKPKKKKVYEVRLIMTTIQRKRIAAHSPEEAIEIGGRDDMEWQEKEEVDGTEITVHSGDATEGRYVDFVNDEDELCFEHFDSQKYENAILRDDE